MKLSVITLVLLLATHPSYGQRNRNDTEAINRACGVEECFLEAQIRDFEVVDRTHLIVYVGAQRCAFHVELRGALCDMTFAPELYFRGTNEVSLFSNAAPRTGTRADDLDPLDLETRERRDMRICDNDLSVQVHGGRFTESQSSAGADRFGEPLTDCRVSNVTSITDDQLLEFYVGRGALAPVPPMGSGEIAVGEQEEEGAASEAPAAAPPTRNRRNADDAE
jgi:hypothetical protein